MSKINKLLHEVFDNVPEAPTDEQRKRSLLQRWVMCRFGKHKYYVIKEYSKTVRKVGCRNCEKVWGMNDRVKSLLEWDGELEELHEGT